MRTITRKQYHQLVGLLALAERQDRIMREILAAAVEITGEDDRETGHTADAMYDGQRRDADALLERLNITVED